MSITIKYSQLKRVLFIILDCGSGFGLWVWLSMLIRHPSHHYFSYFFYLLFIAHACIYGYINSIVGTYQAMVQQESFIVLSLLVK